MFNKYGKIIHGKAGDLIKTKKSRERNRIINKQNDG
jgi:hypothetical protein